MSNTSAGSNNRLSTVTTDKTEIQSSIWPGSHPASRLRTRWWWLAIKIPCPANLPCPGVTQNYRMSLSALSTSSTPLSPSPHSYEQWYPHFCEIEYRYPIIVAQWHTLWSPSLLLCTTVILKFLQNILRGARFCRAIKLSMKFTQNSKKASYSRALLLPCYMHLPGLSQSKIHNDTGLTGV